MRFYFRPSVSPTYHQLHCYLKRQGWYSMPCRLGAQIGEQNFAFDELAAQQLEYKHLLADLLQTVDIPVMPKTYVIDEDSWSSVLATMRMNDCQHRWILKPSLLNNGQYIYLFEDIQHVERYYLCSQRLGGPHVLQRYIENPHLLRGHKYSIRVFVVLTNDRGSFLFPEGYLNVSRYPYQKEFADPRVHLTNEHLKHDETNVIQIPASRLDLFADFYLQIKRIITKLLCVLMQKYSQVFCAKRLSRLAIYGFDFLADANHTIWLLEANHGPCFPISPDHPLQTYVYEKFWEQLISQFLEPIAKGESGFVPGYFDVLV